MLARVSLVFAALALATACGGYGLDSGEGDGIVEAGDAADANPALDLGGAPDAGCTKVDLLFVIDDSHSMATEQGVLIASFPEFIEGVRGTLDVVDSYHIGVITTDAYAFNEAGCRTLGALVTETGGASSSVASCGPFSSPAGSSPAGSSPAGSSPAGSSPAGSSPAGSGPTGEQQDTVRFMTEAGPLETQFACAAQVGVEGSNDERPIEAMLASLQPDTSGCNAGFRRPDALLVVVMITDEEDDHTMILDELHGSPGEPEDWFAQVEALVGSQQNAAILTIIGGQPDNDCGEPKGVGAEDAPRLRAFTNMFSHAYLGDVCAPSYEPFFNDAIFVVEQACEDFVPVP